MMYVFLDLSKKHNDKYKKISIFLRYNNFLLLTFKVGYDIIKLSVF